MKTLSRVLCLLGLQLALVPSTPRAITVECANEYGTCTGNVAKR